MHVIMTNGAGGSSLQMSWKGVEEIHC